MTNATVNYYVYSDYYLPDHYEVILKMAGSEVVLATVTNDYEYWRNEGPFNCWPGSRPDRLGSRFLC